jgi:exodeoxyribonuclease-1
LSTFLFYDLETTGLDPVFDQILQFAAIRTDEALRPMGEPVNWFVRLRPDVIPSPGALLKTNRSVASLAEGRPEYEVIRAIHELISAEGVISIGYNSFQFDDLFLRFGFYRNLLAPYAHHSARNGCGRADLLALVVRFRCLASDALNWPMGENGVTLALEALAAANGCNDGRAHDALADVRASVNLARKLAAHQREWRAGMDAFNRQRDSEALDQLPPWPDEASPHRKGVLLSNSFRKCGYAAPALLLARSNEYGNATYWLRLDDRDLPEKVSGEPAPACWRRKNLGEAPLVVHPRAFSLDEAQIALARQNMSWLADHRAELERLRAFAEAYTYDDREDVDVDAQLYIRDPATQADWAARNAFHAAELDAKYALAADFPDPVDRALAHRLLWRNYGRRNGETECLRPLLEETACRDYKGALKRARAGALAEIDRLAHENQRDADALRRLQEMRAWLACAPAR